MENTRARHLRWHGPRAPVLRFPWQAPVLVVLGLASAFLVVITGFAVALTLIWPG